MLFTISLAEIQVCVFNNKFPAIFIVICCFVEQNNENAILYFTSWILFFLFLLYESTVITISSKFYNRKYLSVSQPEKLFQKMNSSITLLEI